MVAKHQGDSCLGTKLRQLLVIFPYSPTLHSIILKFHHNNTMFCNGQEYSTSFLISGETPAVAIVGTPETAENCNKGVYSCIWWTFWPLRGDSRDSCFFQRPFFVRELCACVTIPVTLPCAGLKKLRHVLHRKFERPPRNQQLLVYS